MTPSAPGAASCDPEARRSHEVRRLLAIAVAVGAVVLVAMIAATVIVVASYQTTTAWVNHTYQVKDVIGAIRTELARAESGRRAYLITRDGYYLRDFQNETAAIPRLEAGFRRLTADNPRQQAAVVGLDRLLQAKLADQTASVRLAEADPAHRIDPARLIRENQGALDQLRAAIAGMVAEEDRLLTRRSRRQALESELLEAVVLASGLMLAALALGSFLLVRRYSADLERSQTALRDLNAGLEDAVARRTAELSRANEEIQRFAYIVSHDLRSPLVNVMGFTSELETASRPLARLVERVAADAPALLTAAAREAVEVDLPESIGFIRTSTQKMDRLIAAILKLSREGRRTLTPEAIDMDALVDAAFGSLRQLADGRGASLEREGELPDLVNDRVAVEQVFGNVVENALKYLKPGRPGRIQVRGRVEGAGRLYEVEDNGRGVDPKDHERIFELFRRAGTQDQPGEGIGLAHVRALVQRLGGTITVHSELDRGATFRVYLPASLSRIQEPV